MMMNDEEGFSEYRRAEDELKQHAHDPLNTELRVYIQALTVERLHRWMAAEGMTREDVAVNIILSTFLYQQGE